MTTRTHMLTLARNSLKKLLQKPLHPELVEGWVAAEKRFQRKPINQLASIFHKWPILRQAQDEGTESWAAFTPEEVHSIVSKGQNEGTESWVPMLCRMVLAGLFTVTNVTCNTQQQTFLTVNTDRIAAHEAHYEKQLARRRFKRRAAVATSVIAGAGTVAFVGYQFLKEPTNGGSGGPRASDAQASDAQATQAALARQRMEQEAEWYTFRGIFKNTVVQTIGIGIALGISSWALEQASKLWTGTNTAWLQELFPLNDKDLVLNATMRLSRQAQIYEQLAGQELVLLASLEPTQAVSRTILIKNIQFSHNSTLRILERLMALTRCSLRGFTDTDNLVAGKLIQVGWQLDNMAESYGALLGGTFTPNTSITLLRTLSVNVQQLAMMIVDLCQ